MITVDDSAGTVESRSTLSARPSRWTSKLSQPSRTAGRRALAGAGL